MEKRSPSVVLFIVTAAQLSAIICITLEGEYYLHPGSGRCMRVIRTELQWRDAVDYCKSDGGELGKITNQIDQNFYNVLLQDEKESFWTQMNDKTEEEIFAFLDGTAISFTQWMVGQPDGNRPGHSAGDCVRVLTYKDWGTKEWLDSAYWDDYNCDNTLYFVCEVQASSVCVELSGYVPETTTVEFEPTTSITIKTTSSSTANQETTPTATTTTESTTTSTRTTAVSTGSTAKSSSTNAMLTGSTRGTTEGTDSSASVQDRSTSTMSLQSLSTQTSREIPAMEYTVSTTAADTTTTTTATTDELADTTDTLWNTDPNPVILKTLAGVDVRQPDIRQYMTYIVAGSTFAGVPLLVAFLMCCRYCCYVGAARRRKVDDDEKQDEYQMREYKI